jgi:hypothetical protein
MSAKKRKKEQRPPAVSPADTRLPAWLDQEWRFVLVLAGFLFLALIVYFRDFIFTPGTMIFGTDMSTQGFQTRKIAVDAVNSGAGLPLWNPFSYCGLPYIGALPGPIFFPTTILYFIMPLERAIGWSYLLMMLAGGLFAYCWIRELGLNRTAAAVCAVAYGFTGWVASTIHGGHDGRMFTILLTPLVFFFLERALNRRKIIYFLLMGAAVALQIVSPHAQMMYFSSLAVTAYFLFRVYNIYREEKSFAAVVKLASGFAAGFAFAVALSAVHFGPLMANQALSHRQASTYEYTTQFSMHPLETVTLLVPAFSGEPDAYWCSAGFKSHCEYMGLIPLIFAAVALVWRRNRHTWFFTFLGLGALLWSFGGFTPFFKLPYYLLPYGKVGRGPNMMFFVFAFSVITLAAYGIDYMLSGRGGKEAENEESTARGFKVIVAFTGAILLLFLILGLGKKEMPAILAGIADSANRPLLEYYYPAIIKAAFVSTVVAVFIVALAFLWRRGRLPLVAFAGLLSLIAFCDLMRMNHRWITVEKPSNRYFRDRVVQHLEKEKEPYRVFFYPFPNTNDYWDNSLLYFQIPTINASMPLRLKWYEELMGTHMFNNLVVYPRLWNMLNTRYLTLVYRNAPVQLGNNRLEPGQFQQVIERSFPFLKNVLEIKYSANSDLPKKVLYENPRAWPRFKLFTRFEVLEDDSKFIRRFNDPGFDPETTLILAGQPEFDRAALDGSEPGGEVTLESYSYDRLELTVRCDQPSLLYLAETYHPYWRAQVDGKAAKIYRANLAMRAVFLKAGEHRVVMRYHSPPFVWGRGLSLASLLVLAAAVGWTFYRQDW